MPSRKVKMASSKKRHLGRAARQTKWAPFWTVLKKYGKEHFLNLPLLVKYPNDYEIKIKNILMSHNINFQYQFRKNKCIPDFYSKGFWVLEATSLYPLRKDERVIQKIKQLQKYLNEFTEKLILVTLFTNEWVRTMEENNLNNRVEVCNDNKLMEIITK